MPPLNPAKSFEDLLIFQEARGIAVEIRRVTRACPFSADRVLVHQVRRAALSVVSNIAEGFERGSRAEFTRFLNFAEGSCGEIRAQMLVASEQNYISKKECEDFCLKAKKISAGLSNLGRYLSQPGEKTNNTKSQSP